MLLAILVGFLTGPVCYIDVDHTHTHNINPCPYLVQKLMKPAMNQY